MSTPTNLFGLWGRTHRLVKGSTRESFNILNGTIDDTTTSVVLTDPVDQISEGSYIGIDTELMFVRSVNPVTKTLTVVRGLLGTEAVTHLDTLQVEIDWRFFTADVADAIGDELRSWPDDIFTVSTQDVTVGTGTTAITVPLTRFKFVLQMRRTVTGKDRWVDVSEGYDVQTNLPTTSFADGNALFLPTSAAGPGTVRIEYAAGFDLSDLDNLFASLAAIGLTNNLIDAAQYGAAWRLLASNESSRSDRTNQPQPREADDVGMGETLRSAAGLKALRDLRLKEEASRLRTKYPFRWG